MASQVPGDPAESASVRTARSVAYLLDESIRIPGTPFRIGLDPIAGILPVAGDTVAAIASLYIVAVALLQGVPKRTVLKMIVLVGVDFVLGSVPVVGTVVDAVLKVNSRNVATLERHLAADT